MAPNDDDAETLVEVWHFKWNCIIVISIYSVDGKPKHSIVYEIMIK